MFDVGCVAVVGWSCWTTSAGGLAGAAEIRSRGLGGSTGCAGGDRAAYHVVLLELFAVDAGQHS